MMYKTSKLLPKHLAILFLSLLTTLVVSPLQALPRRPLPPWPERSLNSWRFDNELTWGGPLSAPLALQGIDVPESWSGYAMRIGPTEPAIARFPGFRSDGRPNLTLDAGTIRLWFAPEWSSVSAGGKGPGTFAPLLEVGTPSPKAEAWWALYLDPSGDTLHFSTQVGGQSADLLSVPISFQAGEWRQIAFVYSEKFCALYLDGALAATGEGMALWPGEQLLASSGFCVGGNASGTALAEGQFEELTTFGYPCTAEEIAMNFRLTSPASKLGPITAAEIESARVRRAQLKASSPEGAGVDGGNPPALLLGGPTPPASPCGTNLCLAIAVEDQYAVLTLWNTQPGTNYQIFSRPTVFNGAFSNPSLASAQLEQELVGVDGRGWTQTVIPMNGRSNLFFWARSASSAEPHLHITSTDSPVLAQPYVQIRGYSETALAWLSYTVINASGGTNSRGYITQQHYDPKLYKFTTNWWQCFDVELAPGFNRVVIQAIDRLGQSNSTTLHFAQLYLPNRPAPQPAVAFPAGNVQVSGTNFTLRGTIDNPTAFVAVQSTAGGSSQQVAGVVERDGTFWVDNLPASPGANSFDVIVTDPGGVSSTNTVAVTASTTAFAIFDPSPFRDLHEPTVDLAGVAPEGATVTVNGVSTIAGAGGSWDLAAVPVPRGGVALFHGEAVVGGGPPLVTELAVNKRTKSFLESFNLQFVKAALWSPCEYPEGHGNSLAISTTNEIQWAKWRGGRDTTQSSTQDHCTNSPSVIVCTTTWDAFNVVLTNTGPCGPAALPFLFEHTSGTGTKLGDGASVVVLKTDHAHHSQSQVHVQSGGRSIARRNGLVRFDATATHYDFRNDPQNDPADPLVDLWNWDFSPLFATFTNLHPIAPASLTVLGKSLHTNNILFENVPAGAEVDCTPDAPSDYYQFDLSAADATPRLYNDVNNDNAIEGPGQSGSEARLREAPPSARNPGKILFVNNGDADLDSVPNFADGFGLFGASQSPDSGGLFSPLILQLPAAILSSNAVVRFKYSESPPLGVSEQEDDDGGFTYSAGGGQLRLWTVSGNTVHSGAPLSLSGHFVDSGTPYDGPLLGLNALPGFPSSAMLFVEGISPSQTPGDAVLKMEVDPDGTNAPAGFIGMDEAYFTVLDIQLTEAAGAHTVVPSEKLKESLPSPTITASAQISNLRATEDGARLLADITVGGTVNSAICDLTPGTNGIITNVFIYLNGLFGESVPLLVSKDSGFSTSLINPFAFSGSFSRTYTGVEVALGENVLRITATDPIVGETGYAELTTEISASELFPNQNEGVDLFYTDLRATLDFGPNVHSMADLLGTNTVRLSFEVLSRSQSYAGDLALVASVLTNGVVLLKNASAWVSLTDTNTLNNYLRGDVRGAHLLTAISVPAFGVYSGLFDLHETGDATSVFTTDYYGLAMGFAGALSDSITNSITARLVRLGGQSVSNLLTETGVNTLFFQTADQSFQIQLSASPPFAATNVDFADATVTSTALSATNYLLNTYETGTNTFVLATIDDLVSADDDIGAYFGLAFGASGFTQTAASDGGELHRHYAQFQGPDELLKLLAGKPNSGLVIGPDGKVYLANSLGAPAAILGFDAFPSGDITNDCTGTVIGGFVKGVAKGLKGFVWDGWHALGGHVGDRTLGPAVDTAFDLYSFSTGSLSKESFLESLTQRIKKAFPAAGALGSYVLGDVANSSGDLARTTGSLDNGVGGFSTTFQALRSEAQEALIVGGLLLSNVWHELQNGCPERRAEIIGRATFEIVTVYAAIVRANQAARATEAAKVTEAELLTSIASGSSVPEVRLAAQRLLGFTPTIPLGNKDFGLRHILRRHSSQTVYRNVSKFLPGAGAHDIRRLIVEAAHSGATWRVEGSKRILETNMGRVIGTTRSGTQTTWLRVVTDQNGSVITAYPI